MTDTNKPVKQLITKTLEKNYMTYAMSVIVSRAIPEIDGFKPSHRKLLYTMYRMGLLTGNRTKSANVVGQTMKLNPHGDQAIYETMVRLTRGNGALLHPYIDSKGNFGRVYSRDMQFAASRYTEVGLDKICVELFSGLEKDSVDFVDNYDNTQKEPLLLPATFPTILVNNNQGIAVGMASNICSFNLIEVCRATEALIKDPLADPLAVMPAPDFATGGQLIYNKSQMQEIYRTGRGRFTLRAVWQIDKKNNLIEITQIPYTTTAEAIIDEVTLLVKQGKIKELNDIRDETDLNGLKITFEYRRSADPKALLQKLFSFTSLESNFQCNFNVLINGMPRVLGVRALLGEWISWRRSCLRRQTAYELEEKEKRLHLMRGLEKILLDIDRAIEIIRRTKSEEDVIPNLVTAFAIDAVQAEMVANIRLKHLNRAYLLQRTKDIRQLLAEIGDLKDILSHKERLDQLIVDHLNQVSDRYGQARKTKLIHEEQIARLSAEDMIEDYRLKFFLTEHGYLKKLALTSLRSAGQLKTKEEDTIVQSVEGTNKSDLLLFSSLGICYKAKAFELADHKPSDLGDYTPNLLELAADEKIVFLHLTQDYSGQFMFAFANGKCARVDASCYQTKTNRKKLVNAFSTACPVTAVFFLDEDDDFIAQSDIRKALIFNSAKVALKATRTNQGVQVMTLKKGDTLVSCRRLSDSGIKDDPYYRTKNIPAVGRYLKPESVESKQLEIK